MISLILETSSQAGLVALAESHKILASITVPLGVRESGDLVASLKELLDLTQVKTSEFNQIILGLGPGSFTGLRVGASVAKALAYVHQLPILGISSLRLFDPPIEGPFVVLLDAKQHGFCLQKGEKKKGLVYYEPLIKKVPLDQLECEIESIPLWITADTASLTQKLKNEMDLDRLVQLAPCPLQMLRQASLIPENEAKGALEPLELRYFDRPN